MKYVTEDGCTIMITSGMVKAALRQARSIAETGTGGIPPSDRVLICRVLLTQLDEMARERDEARAEVHRLQADIDDAVSQGYPHDDVVGESWRRLRQERDEARALLDTINALVTTHLAPAPWRRRSPDAMQIIIKRTIAQLPYRVTALRNLDLIEINGEERIVSSLDTRHVGGGKYAVRIAHTNTEGGDPRRVELPSGSTVRHLGSVDLRLGGE